MPIQWASKKLTTTETKYGISEKEMLAIKWGMEKFSYELTGRTFHLITDHKALEEIRRRPVFSNNRINRWIEAIQEYDFTIEYQKGENLVVPDALSRVFEDENKPKKETMIKGRKIAKGRWDKHVIQVDGIDFGDLIQEHTGKYPWKTKEEK